MAVTPFRSLACPLDGAPLQCQGSAWCCPAGHSFDIASQGYANLLPVHKKRSLDPGDSKEMVAARRRFLNAGFYQPIAAAVSRLVLADLPENATFSCLDAGCGEGYYVRQLMSALGVGQRVSRLGLVDRRSWAPSGTTEDKRPNWVVGSNANLPVLSGTIDRVLCMFGFPVYPEFARILKSGGLLLQVDTGPDHLRELREIIYPTLKPERTTVMPVPDGFAEGLFDTLRYTLTISGAEQIADLLAMTPHLYRATAEGRARAAALTEIALTVDVRLTCFVRTAVD